LRTADFKSAEYTISPLWHECIYWSGVQESNPH
jgi:hypothetical protein